MNPVRADVADPNRRTAFRFRGKVTRLSPLKGFFQLTYTFGTFRNLEDKLTETKQSLTGVVCITVEDSPHFSIRKWP